ncbi:hypothetical protein EV421DRAFT_892519 [Armillaria borealis]|uniref:Uncharacterized protein n=1 Tax=Armillaria borealis TaxID=47425 RepID=A0AA39K2L9_9AGAR|nr:hypothetical protein EV421DRAFT_892519 [Armillaria borealis]
MPSRFQPSPLSETSYHSYFDSSDSEFESDIADECQDIPSRPTSRLGFFGNSSEEFAVLESEDAPAPETDIARQQFDSLKWTCAALKRMSVSSTIDKQPLPRSKSSSSLDDLTVDDAGLSSSEDSDSDSESDSDIELDRLLECNEPPELAFPTPLLPPPTASRRKFSCLPSPLSPSPARCPTPLPNRHDYEQHGYSRHGLHQLKWFWALREEEWIDAAYDGVSQIHESIPRPVPLPPMSVHPRRGDISALRDPFCVHMDRYFVAMPMWTMSKALWMFDMHMAGEVKARSMRAVEDEEEPEELEDDLTISIGGSSSGDDSEVTLVESDGEDGEYVEVDLNEGPSTTKITPVKTKKAGRRRKAYTTPTAVPASFAHRLPWETNWYKRTELLLELTRLDRERR